MRSILPKWSAIEMRVEHRLGAHMALRNHSSFIEFDTVLVGNCAPDLQISTLQIYKNVQSWNQYSPKWCAIKMGVERQLGTHIVLGNHPSFIEFDTVLVGNCALDLQISTIQIYNQLIWGSSIFYMLYAAWDWTIVAEIQWVLSGDMWRHRTKTHTHISNQQPPIESVNGNKLSSF